MSDFGANLRHHLRLKKLTEARAARMCGVRQQTMNYYCHLKNPPHQNIVQRLVINLEIPAEELLGPGSVLTVYESTGIYRPTDLRLLWMATLKTRWKSRLKRDDLALSVHVLFASDAPA